MSFTRAESICSSSSSSSSSIDYSFDEGDREENQAIVAFVEKKLGVLLESSASLKGRPSQFIKSISDYCLTSDNGHENDDSEHFRNVKYIPIVSFDKKTTLYVNRLTSALIDLRKSCSQRQVKEVQRKIQKIAFFDTDIDLSKCQNEEEFTCQRFASKIGHRLHIIREYEYEDYVTTCGQISRIISDGRNGSLTRFDRLRTSIRSRVLRK